MLDAAKLPSRLTVTRTLPPSATDDGAALTLKWWHAASAGAPFTTIKPPRSPASPTARCHQRFLRLFGRSISTGIRGGVRDGLRGTLPIPRTESVLCV